MALELLEDNSPILWYSISVPAVWVYSIKCVYHNLNLNVYVYCISVCYFIEQYKNTTACQLRCCTIVCVYSQDLGRLIIWVLREYQEIEPIILSGEYRAVLTLKFITCMHTSGYMSAWYTKGNMGITVIIYRSFIPFFLLLISYQWGRRMRSQSKRLWTWLQRLWTSKANYMYPFSTL